MLFRLIRCNNDFSYLAIYYCASLYTYFILYRTIYLYENKIVRIHADLFIQPFIVLRYFVVKCCHEFRTRTKRVRIISSKSSDTLQFMIDRVQKMLIAEICFTRSLFVKKITFLIFSLDKIQWYSLMQSFCPHGKRGTTSSLSISI